MVSKTPAKRREKPSPEGPYLWIPGQGYDAAALERMARAFPRPNEPMGEAWFMSAERRMYPELMGDLAAIDGESLQRHLTEIATGTSAFGPFDEWRDWFHYLLPRLGPRSHETFIRPLLEILLTAFFTQYPDGIGAEPYVDFRRDVLTTLGRCMMDAVCWPGGELDPEVCLDRSFVARRGLWFWDCASGPLSASLFLHVKYLDPREIGPWLGSVLAIEEPRWRAQMIVWLLGAYRMLTGAVTQPSEFTLDDHPRIDWEWSHTLKGNYTGHYDGSAVPIDFVPAANRRAALDAAKAHFTEAVFLEWLAAFAADPALEAELADIPYGFFDLYRGEG